MRFQQYYRWRAALFTIVVSLPAASAWAEIQDANLPNFQKVNDYIYRGASLLMTVSESWQSLESRR